MEKYPASVEVLTTREFHHRVLALEPKIAVFDCDGTLWSGDAGSAFMRWTMETKLLSPRAINWLNERYEGYKRGEVDELTICGEMVQVYRSQKLDVMRAAAAKFFALHIERNIFPEMFKLITDLQARGTDIWAVSSTNDWVIEEGVKRFNIPADRVLAARTHPEEDRASGRLIDVPTDQGKVTALARVGITAPDAVFGNSVHDAHMLAIAHGAFPVNPSPALVDRSIAENWAVYYPASVRPPL